MWSKLTNHNNNKCAELCLFTGNLIITFSLVNWDVKAQFSLLLFLCGVFLLLFPLRMATLLHRKLALIGTFQDSSHAKGSNKDTLKILTTFYILWCGVYRRGANIFQQYWSCPKILGSRRVPRRKLHSEHPQILGATVPNLALGQPGAQDLCISDL
jgi:hypothetical protein